MMNRTFLRTLAFLFGIAIFTMGATASDVTTSKNEILVKGATPHVRFKNDNATGDFAITGAGGVLRLSGLQANPLFSVSSDGAFGVELVTPTNLVATPFTSGGSLADGVYHFAVTALDGAGETTASSDASCTVSGGGGSGRCALTWTASPPAALDYRVYEGSVSGTYTQYKATGGPASLNVTTLGTFVAGTPPVATTAYQIRFSSTGIRFPDGSTQTTMAGAGAFQANGSHILNANLGNVGISSGGSVFTPDALLTVLGVIDVNDGGAIRAAATNEFQLRSNYKSSTDRLWNTGQTSWVLSLGDSGDRASISRAPATAGAPAYALRWAIYDTGAVNIGPTNADPLGVVGLRVEGAIKGDTTLTMKAVTHGTTFTAGNETFIFCAGGGGVTINLPTNAAGVISGRVYIIKNINLVGNCTVDPSGAQTIDLSLATLTLTPGDIARLVAYDAAGDWERF